MLFFGEDLTTIILPILRIAEQSQWTCFKCTSSNEWCQMIAKWLSQMHLVSSEIAWRHRFCKVIDKKFLITT